MVRKAAPGRTEAAAFHPEVVASGKIAGLADVEESVLRQHNAGQAPGRSGKNRINAGIHVPGNVIGTEAVIEEKAEYGTCAGHVVSHPFATSGRQRRFPGNRKTEAVPNRPLVTVFDVSQMILQWMVQDIEMEFFQKASSFKTRFRPRAPRQRQPRHNPVEKYEIPAPITRIP